MCPCQLPQSINCGPQAEHIRLGPKAAHNPIHVYDSVARGLFIAYVAAVGDKDAVNNKMPAYAQRNFNPVWELGEYYYPRSDDFSVDGNGKSHGVDPWTGNVFIPMARLNKVTLSPRTFSSFANRCHQVFGACLDLHTWYIQG